MISIGSGDQDGEDTDSSPAAPKGPSLRERAFRFLARRDYARVELGRKLTAYASDPDELVALLNQLEQGGYLSDARFAEQRVVARAKRHGNARLAYELRTKGVDEAIIASALDTIGNEFERARGAWQKKFSAPPASREDWAKQARFLQSRGFSTDIIRRLLNDCDAPDD